VIQDAILYIVAFLSVIYTGKKTKHPEVILVELASFVMPYAGAYENFATF
jgi:hypothetical protein